MAPAARPMGRLVRTLGSVAPFRAGLALRVGLPATAVLVTLLAVDLLRWVFPGAGVFLLLLIPVLLASLTLGPSAGVLALTLGALGAGLMVVLRDHPWLSEPAHLVRMVPYLFLGGFIVLLASVLRETIRQRAPAPSSPAGRLIEPLTPREAQVLGLAAGGLTTDRIADELYLSRNTVKSHLAHAYGKLGAHNRAEAIAAGLHVRVVPVETLTARAVEITSPMTLAEPSTHPAAAGTPSLQR